MRQTESERRLRDRIAVVAVIALVGMLGPWQPATEVAANEAVAQSCGVEGGSAVGACCGSPCHHDCASGGPACHENCTCAEAERYPYGEPQVEPLWKLGRGINNLVLGLPAEIVRNPVIEILKADTVFGAGAGALEGTLVGIGKGFWRMGAGFLDIVTFPAADLDPWYDPELLPRDPF